MLIFSISTLTGGSSYAEFGYALPCSIYVGNILVGRGCVLGKDNDFSKGVLVTARHVVTYNYEFLDNLKLRCFGEESFLLNDNVNRWHTKVDPSIDACWMLLNKEEMHFVLARGNRLRVDGRSEKRERRNSC